MRVLVCTLASTSIQILRHFSFIKTVFWYMVNCMTFLVCILLFHVFNLLQSFIWSLERVLFFSFHCCITNHSLEFPFINTKLLKIRCLSSYSINPTDIFLNRGSLLINIIWKRNLCLISIKIKEYLL